MTAVVRPSTHRRAVSTSASAGSIATLRQLRGRDRDWILVATIALGIALAAVGIWWGWVESWHPDEMALLSFRQGPGALPFEPENQLKPPFHTFFTHLTVVVPVRLFCRVTWTLFGLGLTSGVLALYGARMLQLAMLGGCVYLTYRCVDRANGRQSARWAALLLATSGGMVLHAHFLTVDIPVIFWSVAAFYAAQSILFSGRWTAYVLAGVLTGIAAGTKYNGLGAGIAIPVFHLMRGRDVRLWRACVDWRLMIGVGMVVVGFVAADPYAAIKWREFWGDFHYNYVTTPVYSGEDSSGVGYGLFLWRVCELVGLPLAVVLGLATAGTLVACRTMEQRSRATAAAAMAVTLLYFIKFGGAPRVEGRFVLPIIPMLIVAAMPGFAPCWRSFRLATLAVLFTVVAYNVAAGVEIGRRFLRDPRMAGVKWVQRNVPAGSVLESSFCTPEWKKYPGLTVVDVRMPDFFGKRARFSRVFQGDKRMEAVVRKREPESGVEWFDAARLHARNPDFVALDSEYFDRFLSGETSTSYPEVSRYFVDLLAGRLGYDVVFDEKAKPAVGWLYPRAIVCVDNRLVILKRRENVR